MAGARITQAVAALGLCGLLAGGSSAVDVSAQNAQPPTIPNIAGKILTVLGPIEPSALGDTLMHEHIFVDFQSPKPEPRNPTDDLHVTLANLADVRMGKLRLSDSRMLTDFEESKAEVLEFKKWGGQAIVDVSSIGLGRDPRGLLQMSNVTGLSLVMGAGWYQKAYHPLDMDQKTVEGMTDQIVRDITVGVDGTRIRSGVIGEVGINGNPLTPNEIKSVRASARASRLTGAPISFHVGGYREEKFKVLDIIASEGVEMSRVVMGHGWSAARRENTMAFNKPLLDRGVFMEVDFLGSVPAAGGLLSGRNDRVVAQGVIDMIKAGYGDQLLVGHDICSKLQLKKYGGTGFSYISEYFLPELRRLGASESDIHKIMVENPRRALTFVAPRSPVTGS